MASAKQGLQIQSSTNYLASENTRSSRTSGPSQGSHDSRETQDDSIEEHDEVHLVEQSSSSSILSDFGHLRQRGRLRGKSYWRDVIDELEHAVHCVSQPRFPVIDYSLVLPPRLRQRVQQIQSYDFSNSDDVVFIRDEMRQERPHVYYVPSEQDSRDDGQEETPLIAHLGRHKVEEHFSESQHSDIVRMENEFEKFDLRLDEPVGHTNRTVDTKSWYAKFLCATQEDRVRWKSRLSRSKPGDISNSLDEQAENLMDASAERFIRWLNSIGTMDTSMTPEKVKSLFSIKGDRTLLASVKTDPKEVNAIAQTVADKWNKPHMAIELKYEKHVNDHATRVPQKPILSAFGRTVPLKERPWIKRPDDKVIETVYPNELLTREKIFKGITHLRSTTALIDFYINNPKLARPPYLLQGGDFREMKTNENVMEVPLYEHLGLRY